MMAYADYYLCDVCEEKTFYDSKLEYYDGLRSTSGHPIPDGAGDMRVLCIECARTRRVAVLPPEEQG